MIPILAIVVDIPAIKGNAPHTPHPINPKKNNFQNSLFNSFFFETLILWLLEKAPLFFSAKKISSLASVYGVDIVPHTWGSGLGIYVALNFIANIEPNPNRLVEKDLYIEYDQTENRIREELIIPKLIIKDGYIEIPTSPGLGVDINEEKLNQFKT